MSDENKEAVCNHFDNFKSVDEGALFIGMTRHPLMEVENKFNIYL